MFNESLPTYNAEKSERGKHQAIVIAGAEHRRMLKTESEIDFEFMC